MTRRKIETLNDTSASTARSTLPVTTRFRLGAEITSEQRAFLDTHGFLVFDQVASADEITMITRELERIENQWFAERRTKVNGIPVFFGKNEKGARWVQRFTFSSTFSDEIKRFVHDPRFEPIRKLVGENARVGDAEKDGVVVNRYMNVTGSIYKRLGWHTDGLRDVFYGRMPVRMLNVGLHLDACNAANGGLRIIPGSHTQGFWDTCFRKVYFVSHDADPNEICVETQPGDLTVHDGRTWHRVAQSQATGAASLRRSMYVPYLTGPYEPKDEGSRTPPYHYLGKAMRALQSITG